MSISKIFYISLQASFKLMVYWVSFFHDFSNYDTYERLTNDGLTKWHPAFLSLGKTLDKCAKNIGVFTKDTNLDPNQKSPIDGVVGFCPR